MTLFTKETTFPAGTKSSVYPELDLSQVEQAIKQVLETNYNYQKLSLADINYDYRVKKLQITTEQLKQLLPQVSDAMTGILITGIFSSFFISHKKLDEEFSTFSKHLMEQFFPEAAEPTELAQPQQEVPVMEVYNYMSFVIANWKD